MIRHMLATGDSNAYTISKRTTESHLPDAMEVQWCRTRDGRDIDGCAGINATLYPVEW